MLDKEIVNNSIVNSNFKDSLINQNGVVNISYSNDNSDFFKKIFKDGISELKVQIELGEYESTNDRLSDYMSTEGFSNAENNIKIECMYYRAICLLNMGKYEQVDMILEQILSIDKSCIKYYELQVSKAFLKNNRHEFDKNIKVLKDLKEDDDKIIMYNLNMLYNEERYQEIIKYCIEKECLKSSIPRTDRCIGVIISSLLILENVDLAKKVMSNIEKKTNYLIYLDALINLYEILNKKTNIIELSECEKNILKDNIDKLNSVKEYFNKNKIYIKYYYKNLLSSYLVYDRQKCVEEFNCIDASLQKELDIKLIYIDALILTGKMQSAKDEILKINDYNKNIKLLVRLIEVLDFYSEDDEIIRLLSQNDIKKIEDEGLLISKYLNSLLKVKGEEILNEIEEEYLEYPLVNIVIAENLYITDKNIEDIKKYCDNAADRCKYSSEAIIEIICEKLDKFGFYDKVIKILENYPIKLIKTKMIYVRNVIKYTESSEKSENQALNIIDELLDIKNDEELLIYKGIILKRKNRNLESFNCYLKAFEISKSEISAYYCLTSKLESKQYDGINEYIEALKNCKNSQNLYPVAMAYAKLNQFDNVYKTVYRMIYLLDNEKNLDIYARITIGIFINECRNSKWEKPEKVENNTIVYLNNDRGTKKVCIETDINFEEEKNYIWDVELIKINSKLSNKIRFKHKKDEIEIDGEKYKITKILNKYLYIFEKVRDYLFENIPENNPYMKTIVTKENVDSIIEQIIPMLQKRKEHVEKNINAYRLKENEVGLTLGLLSRNIGVSEISLIKTLVNDNSGLFFVGEVADNEIQEYMITLQSLVCAKIFGMEYIILKLKDKIHIAKSVINKLNEDFIDVSENVSSGSLGINDEGKIYMIEEDAQIKKDNIEFVRELLELANELVVDEVIIKENDIIISFLDEDEQDSLYWAKENNYTLIADDLCLRKIHKYYTNKMFENVNIIELVKYGNFQERLEILKNISKTQYIYCVDKDEIVSIIKFSQSIEDVSTILNNLFDTYEKYLYYKSIVAEAILEVMKYKKNRKVLDRLNVAIKIFFDSEKQYN